MVEGLERNGRTYTLKCANCKEEKWPWLSHPPEPGWVCSWCAVKLKPKPPVVLITKPQPVKVERVRDLVTRHKIRPRRPVS